MLLRRAIPYALLTVFTAIAYALLVTGGSLVLKGSLQVNNPFITGAIIFLLALLINPLREKIQGRVAVLFSKEQGAIFGLADYPDELTRSSQISEIVDVIQKYLIENFNPTATHIFLHDPLSDHYTAQAGGNGDITSDLRFPSNNPLPLELEKCSTVVFLEEANAFPETLVHEKARLRLLGSQVLLPLLGRGGLTGWVSLGPRMSGEKYTVEDIQYLEALSGQAALALERALVLKSLERRVHEMNVLTRVSQGINVTLAFDDLLELIYAQSAQVIPTLDYRITLQDPYRHHLYHSFYLENDERVNNKENIPLSPGVGLEHLIVQSRRPLVSDDYEKECSQHAVRPGMEGVYAWIGVPLNAGSETIGLLSLGSRDPSVIYTRQQMEIFQSIADQTAGAIVKGRLLEESEKRTRQLIKLNEVTRSLTSTLELEGLYGQILASAVEILYCEGGCLLLLDQTQEALVFEAAVGPVATELIGEQLPMESGLVGQCVQSKQPILANEVRQSKIWNSPPTGDNFQKTQDIMIVPLQVKDQVIGVIEVVNKKDGLPFNSDDQELLIAYSSQAGTSIENARLYTLTDQALAARVEELSVMQHIDRELNASLDVRRAMDITIKWALQQSDSEAGIIGWVNTKGILVMASSGKQTQSAEIEGSYLSNLTTILEAALESGLPKAGFLTGETGLTGLSEGAQTQIAIPIRRETGSRGALILESSQAELPSDEVLVFLSRLSDHAAIAIANAQLYAEVQAANLAKSEFVSFVSHELKTPMTSIKGFTDLLAVGAVGPVNEAQSNFLSTIRSNVDRMATLVSDLADVSRIEAGRLFLDFTAVPLQEVIGEVTRSVRAQVEAKEQAIHLDLPDDLPNAWADRTRLIQILTNLLSNAYKYSPTGGTILLAAKAVQNVWDPRGAAQVLLISVKDEGFGISEEDRLKIFQKFFRSEDQKIRDSAGTGLGLSITRTLVEMQGGLIWFETEYRSGTTFYFTVPVIEGTLEAGLSDRLEPNATASS
jgi:signal transduction histidine kinase/putative methionine-R-sulfoxide reductase with GAF domain